MGASAQDPAARCPVTIQHLGMGESKAVGGTGADHHHLRPYRSDQVRGAGSPGSVVGGKQNRAGKIPARPLHQPPFRPGLDVPGEQKCGLSQGRLEHQ